MGVARQLNRDRLNLIVPASPWPRRPQLMEDRTPDRADDLSVTLGDEWPNQNSLDARSRGDQVGSRRDHDQRVGADEGGQSGRRLRPGGRCVQMSLGVDANDTSLKLDAVRLLNVVIEQ